MTTAWPALLAGAAAGRVDIPIVGDSVTEGQGATLMADRYATVLNGLARLRFPGGAGAGAGGLGFIPIYGTGENSFTWPVAHTAQATSDLGPVRFCSQSTSAVTWTWTAPAGTTSVQVMYYNANATSVAGTFSYQVGSGPVTQVSNTGTGSGNDGQLTPGIAISGGQVLTLTWVSGAVFMDGILHFAGDEDSGVTFHALGHSGWTAGTSSIGWGQGDGGFDWRPSLGNLISGTGGLSVFLGLNDANAGSGNETAAQFQTDLTNLIAFLQANASIADVPLMIIAAYEEDQTLVDPWADYVTAMTAVATAAGATLVNLGALGMPPVADDPSLYADAVHPNNAGHALLASLVLETLAPPAASASPWLTCAASSIGLT